MYLSESLDCDVTTNIVVVPDNADNLSEPSSIDYQNNFKIVIGDKDSQNTCEVSWNTFNEAFFLLKKSQRSETLLIEAVKNFIRKINILELNESLNDEEITEEEFDAEILINANKYVITLNNITSQDDAILIGELVQKIGFDLRDLTTNEVSELFSVKENQLVSIINAIRGQLK